MPLAFVKAAKTDSYAFFGTGSEAFEPNETVPDARRTRVAAAPRPAGRPYAAAAPAAPETSSVRGERTGSAERGPASDMGSSSPSGRDEIEHNRTRSLRSEVGATVACGAGCCQGHRLRPASGFVAATLWL